MMINRTFKIVWFFLIATTMFSCSRKQEQTTTSNRNFRLITYNVWYGFTRVPDRKSQWILWMQEQKPDVVSLQELNEYTPEMLAEDAKNWGHPYTVLLKEEGFPTGITSRYPIEDIHRILEGFHHGLIRVRIQGMYFYVIHLHPSNWETRTREIDLILQDIGGLAQDAPVILAGDFNTFSSLDSIYYAHRRLDSFFQVRDETLNEVNLKDSKLDYTVIGRLLDNGFVDLEYVMRLKEYSFTGSFPTLIEKPGDHGDQRRLDYVFVNEQLADRVVAAKIIADQTTQVLSDHLPVRVDFRFE